MAFSSAPHLHCLPWTSPMKLVSLSTTHRNCRRGLSSNRTNRLLHSLSVSASRSSICTDQINVETEKNTGSTLRELCEGHVPNHVLRRVEEVGYVAPTPVQSEALPVLFSGRDCLIHAQTGSGKTLAYLLLLLSVVNPQRSSVQALIVVPTRELGMQVTKVARMLAAKSSELESEQKSCTVMALLDGGTLRRHKSWLKVEPPVIVIATLRSLCQMLDKQILKLDTMRVLVIDEVDFMFNSSKEVSSLKKLLTNYSSINNRQTVFASASIPQHRRFLYDCIQQKWTKADVVHVHVNPIEPMPSCLRHRFVICGKREKYSKLLHLLQSDAPQSAIIFVGEQIIAKMSFNPLMIILNQNKLTGPNYLDWKRNLDIVLVADEYKFALTTPAPVPLGPDSTEEQKEAHRKWHKANEMARCYILASMSNVLQQQHQSMPNAVDIMLSLKELFGEIDRAARFEAIRKIMSTSMAEGTSVRDHGLKMIEYLNEIEVLGGQIDGETKIDMILNSLPMSFENFHLNVIMSRKDYTVAELLTELVAAEGLMGRTPQANVSVQAGPSSSKGGKKKKPSQKKGGGNSGSKKVAPSGGVKKPKGKCFKCNKTGHWKTDCPLLKKENSGFSANKAAE